MVITKIEKEYKKPDICLVYVDNKFSFQVPEYELYKLDIYEGKKISESELDRLKYQSQFSQAKSAGIKQVLGKIKTVYEVRTKLVEKFEPEIVDEVINWLIENGYLNDELYVEKFITEKKRLRNFSDKAIRYQLYKKGISQDIVDKKLRELGYEEKEHAKALLEKWLKKYGKSKELGKVKEYLFRKGFSMDTIREVLYYCERN